MSAQAHPNPSSASPNDADDQRARPQMFYVDFAKLEATAGTGSVRAYRSGVEHGSDRPRRITTVDAEVADLRRNVKDAAAAVLTWLASVTQHDDADSLDLILSRCLRPGPDATRINYAALAEQINKSLGVDLSPKRIQTAIRHLRQAPRPTQAQSRGDEPGSGLSQRFEELHGRLEDTYQSLVSEQDGAAPAVRRSVAHDVLCVVRSAAGRLIENGFGEGIPEQVDLDETTQRFLVFVRRIVKQGEGADGKSTLRADLSSLLGALDDYDASAESDMQLVARGAAVVADLAGPGSLPGLMARLNVLMAGRPILETDFFVSQMLTLADSAGELINDRATRAYMGWVRQQPKDRQTPSPNRVRSYCLNNAATHILQRLHTQELAGGQWFDTALRCFETMQLHDRGFKLIKTTEAIMLSVLADLTDNTEPVQAFFRRLGRDKSLELLGDLRRFDNSDDLNRLVRGWAGSVHAGLDRQLLVLFG